jgi:endo-1,4-beta-D-glucanase Y
MVNRPLALSCLALCSVLFAACANGGGDSSGTGGSTGSGGTSGGNGGNGGDGGSSGLFITKGPFPFPQNVKPASCSLTSVGNASTAALNAYNSWKNTYVTANGAGGFLRVQRPDKGNDTVSEGIGYGMMAAVYVADRATFDGLWGYAKAHVDTHGLMNWNITAGGATAANGAGSASDGDEDMAWALLMASGQWQSQDYLDAAKTMIDAIFFNCVGPDTTITGGDNQTNDTKRFPDYFSPAYYRVFAAATENAGWMEAVDKGYTLLAQVTGTFGLVPDQSTTAGAISGNYGYDACRMPWRIGMDWCFNSEPRAQAYLTKIGGFFNNIGGGAGNIGDGYSPSGSSTSNNHNMAFIGPAGVAGMAGFQSLLDGAFNYGVSNPSSGGNNAYFPQSLRVVTMLMMSGNLVDYTQR